MSILLALSFLACKDGGAVDDTQDSVEVVNTPPVIESVTLSPDLPLTADAVVATVVSSDADGDTLTTSYAWTVNGQAVGTDSDTLPADLSVKDQRVVVTVTVDDGTDSVSLESGQLLIGNTLPVLESVGIGPEGATTRDDLICLVPSEPTDADPDKLKLSILWMQNGVEVSPLGADQVYPGDHVLASQTEGDDVWSCEVSVSDGEASVSQSAEITLPPSKEVLLIWDVTDIATPDLVETLQVAGLSVTYSDTDENSFDGTNPSLAGFDSVLHLNGTTYESDMPEAGQQALVDFVNAGGGYVHTEWIAYERNATLGTILALERTGGQEGLAHTYTISSSHPVVASVPATFTTVGYCGGNTGTVSNGATALATVPEFGDAVAVNEIGTGRVVGFAHAGNYGNQDMDPSEYCLADPNLLQMLVDGLYWTTD